MRKIITLYFLFLLLTATAKAQVLDPSFGTGGKKILTDVPAVTASDKLPTAVQSDGKIIVAGADTGKVNSIVCRLKSDGSFDSTFGTNGKVILDLASAYDIPVEMRLQNDGKILVAGSTAVARLNKNGSLDLSFNGTGKRSVDISINRMLVQSDGKIVLASGFAAINLIRLNEDGNFDNTFGVSGKVHLKTFSPLNNDSSPLSAIAQQNDGKIILSGFCNDPTTSVFAFNYYVVRFNVNGSLDNSFAGIGYEFIDVNNGFNIPSDVLTHADGTIIIIGSSEGNFEVVRLKEDGSFDNTLNGNGKLSIPVHGYIQLTTAATFQTDGKLLIVGAITGNSDFDIMRLNANGSLDNTFNGTGIMNIPMNVNGGDRVGNVAVLPKGKILLTGKTTLGIGIAQLLTQKNNFYQDKDGDEFGNAGNTIVDYYAPKGYVADNKDCDDNDASVYPGAPELCGDNKDNNCNGQVDEGLTKTWYPDRDGDGYGTPDTTSTQTCMDLTQYGYVTNNGDCNDNDAKVHPGAAEICGDGIDNNCNGQIDEGCTTGNTWYRDADGDGWGDPASTKVSATQPRGYVSNNLDCNDKNNTKGGPEVCDGIDNDCDGIIDNGLDKKPFYSDFDGDGYGSPKRMKMACSAPPRYVSNDGDCNDDNATVYPGAPELCDGRDNDCNGKIDDGLTLKPFYWDHDKDGYGFQRPVYACAAPPGYISIGGDFNDNDPSIHPGAVEHCDGIDEDCDGVIDNGFVQKRFYKDRDGDGWGSNSNEMAGCAPPGYVEKNGDCNDYDASIHPEATEIPGNGMDDNCNGQVDETTLSTTTQSKTVPVLLKEIATLQLAAAPNPAQHYFTLHISSTTNKPVQLRIVDAVGLVLDVRAGITPGSSFTVGHNYRPGVYYVQAVQEGKQATLKLIKTTR